MALDYTSYAHSRGFYALRGKSAEFKKLAEELYDIDSALRFQVLLETPLGRTTRCESDLLKSYRVEQNRIIEELIKVSKPRKDSPA